MSPHRKLRKLHMRVASSCSLFVSFSLSLSTSLFNLRLIPPQRDMKRLTANAIESRCRLSVVRVV